MDNNLLWQYVEEIFATYDKDLNGYLDQKQLTIFFNQVFAKINQGQTTTDQEVLATIRSVDPAFKGTATKQGIFRVLKHMLSQNFSSAQSDRLNEQQYGQHSYNINEVNPSNAYERQTQKEQIYDENNEGHRFPLVNQNQQYKNYGNSNMPNEKQNQAYINYGNHSMPNVKQNQQYKNANTSQQTKLQSNIQSNQNMYQQPNEQSIQINKINPQSNPQSIQNSQQSTSTLSQNSQGSQKNLLSPQSNQQNVHGFPQNGQNNFRMTQSSQQNPHYSFQNQAHHQQVQYLPQQQQFRAQPQPQYQPQYQFQQPQYQYQNHYIQGHPQQQHYVGQSYSGHQQFYFNHQPYVSANNNDDDSPTQKYHSNEPLNIQRKQHPIEDVKNVTQNVKDDNYLRSSASPTSHDYANSHLPRHESNEHQNEVDEEKGEREIKTETSIGSGGKITIPSLLNP